MFSSILLSTELIIFSINDMNQFGERFSPLEYFVFRGCDSTIGAYCKCDFGGRQMDP